MSSEDVDKNCIDEQLEDTEHPSAGPVSSLKLPQPSPRLPTPSIDQSPLGDFLLGPTFTPSNGGLHKRALTVEKLSQENSQLDQQLKELSKRLEAAEQKRLSLLAKRESRMPNQSDPPSLNAGNS